MIFWRNAPFPRSCLHLCNYEGHHSRKNAFLKSPLLTASFASEHFVIVHPLFCGEIALENSAMLCIGHFSLMLTCAALNTEAMAATNALASKSSPSRFCYHFFSFTFFLLFFLYFFPLRKVQ